LVKAIKKAGYEGKIKIGMDAAASEFYKNGKYIIGGKNDPKKGKKVKVKDLAKMYIKWVKKYPIVSIEDPFDQDDFKGNAHITKEIGKEVQIVGDDLLVTNPRRVKRAITEKACNCLLLKVNQIGSVTEAIEACKLAQKAGWGVMMSHRSGETEDSFIADFVVGLKTGEIKSGAPCRSERLAKYNQLLRIEEHHKEAGDDVEYAGENFRHP